MTSDVTPKLHFVYFENLRTLVADTLNVYGQVPPNIGYSYPRTVGIRLTKEQRHVYNKEALKLYLGTDFVSGVDYVAFIMTDDQSALFNGTYKDILSKYLSLELVHQSEKFCNTNYFRGNNLQLTIYKAAYVE